MKPIKKTLLFGTASIFLIAVCVLGWLYARAIPIGTGYVAKYLCSSTFISERDPETVFEEDIVPVNPLAKLVDYHIDRQRKTVTSTSFGLFPLTAVYREGCGCSLVIGTTAEEMRAQKLVEPEFQQEARRLPDTLPWPHGNGGPVDPESLGVNKQLLNAALDAAFEEPDPDHPRKTRAVVVIYDGRLIAEKYAPGFHREMPLLGWSMGKSITSALVGILVKEGRLDIKKPSLVPEWQTDHDPRKKITLDQMLRMSSGLTFEETYAPLYDATDMLYGSYDFAAYAASKPLETSPDGKWNYSSGTANIVARIVRQALEEEGPYYYRFIREKLFDKIGMTSAFVEPDSSGTFVGSSYGFATPRDWAKFGLLYLKDGVWKGERILPEGWVDYTTTPTPLSPRGEYGAMFWLNAGAKGNPADRRWPDAPTDAFGALGFQEQKMIVIPSKNLVLVRFGATTDRKSWDTNSFIRDVLKALPKVGSKVFEDS